MADDKTPNADFIGRVVGDAKTPPETRMLTGWLGDAADEGYRRLYTDAELSSYIDIPDDAILYAEPIRDVQPAGGVLVWIKRDAALKQGGSAASRAARFLQGQVQQDFTSGKVPQDADSLRKAGYRCVTQDPCPEPTGVVGICTKQPDVGGAWPCITAAPQCAVPTGFTGKCTHQPWPNPTQYLGCTIYHCPTHDLTHIPHICNIVATGLPGCGGVEPPPGGTDEKPAADEAVERPVTNIPGCGYTRQWGLCETQLLGCGFTKEWGNQCPTQLPGCGETRDCPTTIPGCGWSRNPICTDLPGCGFQTLPPKCPPVDTSQGIPCDGPPDIDAVGAATRRPFCLEPLRTTQPDCFILQTRPPQCLILKTVREPQCFRTVVEPRCFQVASPFCRPFDPFNPGTPVFRGGRFGAAAPAVNPSIPGAPCPTPQVHCETIAVTELCTKILEACQTKAPEWCPDTQCGPKCQTQQVGCPPTNFNPPCPTDPHFDCTLGCTQIGTICPTPKCPEPLTMQPCPININQVGAIGPTGVAGCTQVNCPRPTTWTLIVAQCPTQPNGDCTFFDCTQFGPQCPTQPNGDCTFFGGCPTRDLTCTQSGPQCPPTPATTCTQFGPQCPTQPNGDCTFFGGCPTRDLTCTQFGPQCPPTPATVCTQFGPQCPTQPKGDCTFFGGCPTRELTCTQFGPQCPPTPATTCTQFGPQCPTQPNGDCTFFGGCPTQDHTCTQFGPQCPPTPATTCTQFGPQCPTQPNGDCTFFNCPTMLCPAAAAAPEALAAPTLPITRCAPCVPQTIPFCPPTAPPRCTQMGPLCPTKRCPLPGVAEAAGAQPGAAAQVAVTAVWQCIAPTPATRCFICPPLTRRPWQCPPSPWCPPITRSPFQCPDPSAVDACPTRLCGF